MPASTITKVSIDEGTLIASKPDSGTDQAAAFGYPNTEQRYHHYSQRGITRIVINHIQKNAVKALFLKQIYDLYLFVGGRMGHRLSKQMFNPRKNQHYNGSEGKNAGEVVQVVTSYFNEMQKAIH